MPRRAPKSAASCQPARTNRPLVRRKRGPWVAAALVAALAGGVTIWALVPASPARLRARAEGAERSGDWLAAARRWHAFNQTLQARGATQLAEARAWLAADRAASAERALRRANAADPEDPTPWRLRLQLYRVEGRDWEARRTGEEAIAAVLPSSRREVLRDATLALLADLPEAQARGGLDRWIAADPADLDARVARLRRTAENPAAGDPDRAARIATLTARLAETPDHIGTRALLVESLADAGDPQRGRQVLDAWSTGARDARYDRLLGRWRLDYEHDPAGAAACFEHALIAFPYDWRTHYRLARALRALGRDDDARHEAELVGRLRDTLDPAKLGPRLAADVEHLDDPASCRDLADLCARVGLTELANAWRREAEHATAETPRAPAAL